MATLTVDGNHLVVLLSALEKIGALRGNISVPLSSVRAVRVSDTPWSELRGIRAPGTGLPRVISLGTRRGAWRPRLRCRLRPASRARRRDDRRVLRPPCRLLRRFGRASGLAHAPR